MENATTLPIRATLAGTFDCFCPIIKVGDVAHLPPSPREPTYAIADYLVGTGAGGRNDDRAVVAAAGFAPARVVPRFASSTDSR